MAGPAGRPKLTAKERRERAARALDLRTAGLGYREIAHRLGYSVGAAHNDVENALKEITREPAESLLAIELARTEELYALAIRYARAGEVKGISAAVSILDRRAKYLALDGAAKVDVTGEVRSKLDDLLDAAPPLPEGETK